MATQPAIKQLALDTNLLFDLAAGEDFAHCFREVFQARGYWLLITPTVLQELTFAALRGTGEKRRLALKALKSMTGLGIAPIILPPIQHGIAQQFARKLIGNSVLPAAEMNDSLIIAETSCAGVPVLVSSDKHLINMDNRLLASCFTSSDLFVVAVAHPKALLKAFR
jgi:predicted nucleic acid-binding protein